MAPNLVTAGDSLLFTWLEALPEGKGHTLRFARFAGGRWGKPATVAAGPDFFANWADFPAPVQARDGSLVVHWLQKNGPGTYAYHVKLARSTDGGATWKATGTLHADRLAAEHGFVSWLPEAGGVRGFWLDGRKMVEEGPMGLRTALVRDGVAQDETLLDERVCECCQTDAALTDAGPVVVYRDRSATEVRDIMVIRKTPTGWSRPVRVHADDWQIPGCPVNGPAVAASGRRVAVAWFTSAPPDPRVQVAFSRDGGATFGPPVLIDGDQPLGRVDLVLDAKGDAVVSWDAYAPGGAAVRLRRATPDGKLGGPVTVTGTTASRASGFPRMARLGDILYIAWVAEGEPSQVRMASLPTPPPPTPAARPHPLGSSAPGAGSSPRNR